MPEFNTCHDGPEPVTDSKLGFSTRFGAYAAQVEVGGIAVVDDKVGAGDGVGIGGTVVELAGMEEAGGGVVVGTDAEG